MTQMHLNKDGSLDLRFRVNKSFEVKELTFWRKYGHLVCVALIGVLAGAILAKTIWDNIPMKNPQVKRVSEVKKVQTVEAKETPFCFDPITCIRDIGEQMGFANQEVITAIKIAKCESGLRPDALNKNKNGTFDVGVFQINDVHGKRISRSDRLDFVKNIRFAWTLRKEQGHWGAWSCYKLTNK